MISKLKNIFRLLKSRDYILVTSDKTQSDKKIEVYVNMDTQKAMRICIGTVEGLKAQAQMEGNLKTSKEIIK